MNTTYRLEHVGLGVPSDKLETTIRFYEQVFGWHRIKEVPGRLAFIGDGAGGRIEIFSADSMPLPAPHHLAFVVDVAEFDGVAERLQQTGAELKETQTNPFGDRLLFFTDPTGNYGQICGRVAPLAQ
jgi:predicted enzyme related to lactoylglutathione lyase